MAVTQSLSTAPRDLRNAVPVVPFPFYVNHRTVTTVEDETVPAGANVVFITPDADVWMANGTGAAVVPSSDVTDGTGSFLLKAGVCRGFFVVGGQKLAVASASGTAHVSFEYHLK